MSKSIAIVLPTRHAFKGSGKMPYLLTEKDPSHENNASVRLCLRVNSDNGNIAIGAKVFVSFQTEGEASGSTPLRGSPFTTDGSGRVEIIFPISMDRVQRTVFTVTCDGCCLVCGLLPPGTEIYYRTHQIIQPRDPSPAPVSRLTQSFQPEVRDVAVPPTGKSGTLSFDAEDASRVGWGGVGAALPQKDMGDPDSTEVAEVRVAEEAAPDAALNIAVSAPATLGLPYLAPPPAVPDEEEMRYAEKLAELTASLDTLRETKQELLRAIAEAKEATNAFSGEREALTRIINELARVISIGDTALITHGESAAETLARITAIEKDHATKRALFDEQVEAGVLRLENAEQAVRTAADIALGDAANKAVLAAKADLRRFAEGMAGPIMRDLALKAGKEIERSALEKHLGILLLVGGPIVGIVYLLIRFL